jgi:hypothetical protein
MAGVSRLTAIPIVLVHGGFVDGSGWESVYKILTKNWLRVFTSANTAHLGHRGGHER